MAHERQDIRDAVVALLSGHTDAGTRVFKSRMAPLRNAELPAISVYTDTEETDPTTFHSAPRELKRTITIAVDAWVNAADNMAEKLDDTFDDIALQIEAAMDADTTLADSVYWSAGPVSTEMGVKMDGNRPMGCVHLEYTAVYHTDLRTAAVDVARDDFDTAAITYEVDPDMHVDDRAEDLVDNIHE